MLLTIIIPVYNEERLVCRLLEKVIALKLSNPLAKEIIIIDDGSTDSTYTIVEQFLGQQENAEFHLLRHETNQGKGAAVRTGMAAANGDIIIIQDADLEYDPKDINNVVRPILEKQTKVVYGSRVIREKEMGRSGFFGLITGKHPHSYVLAYLGGVMITKWTNLVTGAKLTDEPTCYKCFHRSVLEGIRIECDDFSWEPEITVKLLQRGYEILEVPISYYPRKNSEGKKINWVHGVKALWTIWSYR